MKLTTLPEVYKERDMEILWRDEDALLVVPQRIVSMKLLLEDGTTAIKRTIVPSMTVTHRGEIEDGQFIYVGDIRYLIAGTTRGFPLAHVYRSGSGCYGNLPISRRLSIHHVLQPFDTLCLYNDRNVNHGSASLSVSNEHYQLIMGLLSPYDIYTNNPSNWIEYDTLWNIGAALLERTSEDNAHTVMAAIFQLLFGEQTSDNKKG